MYLTEREIMLQHEALEQTYMYLCSQKENIENFFAKHKRTKFNVIGCGSSYMLAKSGQRMFASDKGMSANAIAGGDYLTNPNFYKHMIEDSIVISLSRSGKTTEMVRAISHMKDTTNCKVVSLSMLEGNDLEPYADLNLIMDWCYDKSVCQTRTVTNLYLALSMLYAFGGGQEEMIASLKQAVDANQSYKDAYRPLFRSIAEKDWDDVVVLADGPVVGIAEEGALAFTEICMIPGSCFNLLDYRHGPMVLNQEKTLTIMLLQPGREDLQKAMVEDMKAHNGIVITVSDKQENLYGTDAHVCVGALENYIAWGIPFINVMQIIAYEKAIVKGTNPDAPMGLDAYITL